MTARSTKYRRYFRSIRLNRSSKVSTVSRRRARGGSARTHPVVRAHHARVISSSSGGGKQITRAAESRPRSAPKRCRTRRFVRRLRLLPPDRVQPRRGVLFVRVVRHRSGVSEIPAAAGDAMFGLFGQEMTEANPSPTSVSGPRRTTIARRDAPAASGPKLR